MTKMATKSIALLSGSGKLGPFLLAKLSSQEDFSVTVIARQSSKTTYKPDVNVEKVSDDLDKSELVKVFRGKDCVVVSLAHQANHEHHRKIMDAAAEAGVKHFIPNHWGSNAELPIFENGSERSKALAEDIDYLRTKEASGMTWTAIIPGIFFDLAFTYGLLGVRPSTKTAEIWDDGNGKFSASTNEDIATATVAVLQHQDAVKNRHAYVSSFEVTQNELLEISQSLFNGQWDVVHVNSEDKEKEARASVASGAQGMQWLIAQGTLACVALFGGEQYQADFVTSGRSSNLVLGLEQRNPEECIAQLCR